MTSRVTFTGKEHSGKATRTKLYLPDVSSANFDAISTDVDELQAAIDGVSLITFGGLKWAARDEPVGGAAVDDAAQRELKWLVRYTDDVNPIGNGNFEIGGADTSLLGSGTEFMNLGAGAGLALKTAIEANAVSRLGNSITVTNVQLVGRTFSVSG